MTAYNTTSRAVVSLFTLSVDILSLCRVLTPTGKEQRIHTETPLTQTPPNCAIFVMWLVSVASQFCDWRPIGPVCFLQKVKNIFYNCNAMQMPVATHWTATHKKRSPTPRVIDRYKEFVGMTTAEVTKAAHVLMHIAYTNQGRLWRGRGRCSKDCPCPKCRLQCQMVALCNVYARH